MAEKYSAPARPRQTRVNQKTVEPATFRRYPADSSFRNGRFGLGRYDLTDLE